MPLVAVDLPSKSLVIKFEVDEPAKKITFESDLDLISFTGNFEQLDAQLRDPVPSSEEQKYPVNAPIARQTTQILSESALDAIRQSSRSNNISFSIDEECFIFECFKERSNKRLFGGNGFLKFNLVIERLPDWDVWQVTIISEAYCPGLVPEEVFLLENVEQILYGVEHNKNEKEATDTARPSINSSLFSRFANVMQSKDTSVAAGSDSSQNQDQNFVIFCMRPNKNGAPVNNIFIKVNEKEQMERLLQAFNKIMKN